MSRAIFLLPYCFETPLLGTIATTRFKVRLARQVPRCVQYSFIFLVCSPSDALLNFVFPSIFLFLFCLRIRSSLLSSSLCLSSSVLHTTATTPEAAAERKALLALFWCTAGPDWCQKSGWQDAEIDLGQWSGVQLDPSHDGVVVLDLRRRGLTGLLLLLLDI